MKTEHILCGAVCVVLICAVGFLGCYVYKLLGNLIFYPIEFLLRNIGGFYNTAHRMINQKNISNGKAVKKIHQKVDNVVSTVVDFNPVNILLSQVVRSLRISSWKDISE